MPADPAARARPVRDSTRSAVRRALRARGGDLRRGGGAAARGRRAHDGAARRRRLAPAAILDAGCGTGEALPELAARYPQARRVALDVALPMLAAARARTRAGRSLLDRLLASVGGRAPGAPALRLRRLAALPVRGRRVRSRLEQSRRCNGSPTCRARSPNSTACSKSAGSSRSRRSDPTR